MKTILSFIFFIFFLHLASAQSLRILDPQTWDREQGTISETKITFEPQGLYTKVNWEITFKAKDNSRYSETDTVEVEYRFELPKGASIIDSKLWFEDSILNALIIDRWSASQVYESIVNRRRDPSILYKNSDTRYELRIFPMAAKKSRKVRLSILVPTVWSKEAVSTKFFSENLMVSTNSIENIDIYLKSSEKWDNPRISGSPDLEFEQINDDEGNSHHLSLQHSQLAKDMQIEFSSPMRENFYLSIHDNGDDNFYQLAMYPTGISDMKNPQKVMILIDFENGNSDLTQKEMLDKLSENLDDLLNEKDSFNIVYHDTELHQLNENWISGDSTSIYHAIETLGEEPFASYGSLATLLASGIELTSDGSENKLLLLANSDKMSDLQSANDLIDDLMELNENDVPIYIGDFQTTNYNYLWGNGVSYRGNEYLYVNLAKQTGGDYYNRFDGDSFSECLRKTFFSATYRSALIDIHTTLNEGLCYGRFAPTDQSENIFDNIYLETGRYSGEFPFKVEVSGIYEGELFSNNITINKEDAHMSDSTLVQWWHGKEIEQMEQNGYSYNLINDIIDLSVSNRVLSMYTAFLCLEPGMEDMLDNLNNTNTFRGTDEVVTSNSELPVITEEKLVVYPNPFRDQTTINIEIPESIDKQHVKIEVYDLYGKLVKTFTNQKFFLESIAMIKWDGTRDNGSRLASGTYLVVCSTPNKTITKKVMIL